jgi:hypothetical protein
MKKIPFAGLFFLIAISVAAQQKSPSFEELQRQMLELQQQMLKEFHNNPFGGGMFTIPEGDSSYTFRFDTTITGDNFSGTFRFGPFSGDSTLRDSDPFGFEWLRNQLFGNGSDSDFWGPAPDTMPRETQPEDEPLLPEERMRLEEEQSGKGATEKGNPAAPAKPAKPKIKSIRI